MVQQYREEKAEYMVKCQEKGIPLDPYFVGRDQILSEVIQHLKKPSSGSKGISSVIRQSFFLSKQSQKSRSIL